MSFLDKIRQRTDSEKRAISFYFALLITILIFVIWLIATLYSLQSPNKKQTASPIDAITESVKSLFSGNKETYINPQNTP